MKWMINIETNEQLGIIAFDQISLKLILLSSAVG